MEIAEVYAQFYPFIHCNFSLYRPIKLKNISPQIIVFLILGPLFLNDGNHKPTLIGVTSFGRACGHEKSPAIFAKVDHVLDWINRTMSKYD